MIFSGLELLPQRQKTTLKMVFNDSGAIVFPASFQHRDQKMPGISYEDDYQGNALAAMLNPERIEIRFHRDFPDERVLGLIEALLSQEEMASLRGLELIYQGRKLQLR